MSETFPAVGHKYLVDFSGDKGEFRVQLDFHSATSLTYTGVNADGSLDPTNTETVVISVEPLRDQQFLVTWQEKEGDTVVHVEDYLNNTIITNITQPGPDLKHPKFMQFHGPMKQIS
jgi:hypothetical protein